MNTVHYFQRTYCSPYKWFFSSLHTLLSWWRHQMETFPRYWPFALGIHRSPVNFPHKCQRRGTLMFALICAWINPPSDSTKANRVGAITFEQHEQAYQWQYLHFYDSGILATHKANPSIYLCFYLLLLLPTRSPNLTTTLDMNSLDTWGP